MEADKQLFHHCRRAVLFPSLARIFESEIGALIQLNKLEKEELRIFIVKLFAETCSTAAHVFTSLILLRRLGRLKAIESRLVPGSKYLLASVCLISSHKQLDDNFTKLECWSATTGIPEEHLAQVEWEFLSALNYGVLVTSTQYEEEVVDILHSFVRDRRL